MKDTGHQPEAEKNTTREIFGLNVNIAAKAVFVILSLIGYSLFILLFLLKFCIEVCNVSVQFRIAFIHVHSAIYTYCFWYFNLLVTLKYTTVFILL